MKKLLVLLPIIVLQLMLASNYLFAHCDTMDGPVVADAKKALELNNVNLILKWVQPADEKEIKDAFELTMKVRGLNQESKDLADKYFFETLVRVHRNGEGVAYTGIKPAGTPIEKKILAADKSIDAGNLSPLEGLVPKEKLPELKELFEKVMSLKKFDVNNVEAGREYIEAYVKFFHFAEGEEEAGAHEHGKTDVKTEVHQDVKTTNDLHKEGEKPLTEPNDNTGHITSVIPWASSGIFFVTTLIFGVLYFRKKK